MAEWQKAMSSREFAEWVAYAGMEPFGETRADIRIATLAALFAEANRDRKRRRKAFSVGEFVELFRGQTAHDCAPPQDPDRKKAELWANLKAWACAGKAPADSRGPSAGSLGSAQTAGVRDRVRSE